MESKSKLVVALTVAGSDPSGGAGVQSDLKTFAALGVYGFSAITAIIAQNSAKVFCICPVSGEMLSAQLEALMAERTIDAMKTGALATSENVAAIAEAIRRQRLPAPVVDPVILASSGARLLDPAGEAALRDSLIPLARVVTPNLHEAELLSGMEIDSRAGIRAAARAIRKLGARAVIIKGGHQLRRANPDEDRRVTDVLFDGRSFIEFSGARVRGAGAHGTGCALSAAIAAHLALGADLETAMRKARRFVTRALASAITPGSGRPVLDHFARAGVAR
jgi:hydroxymethylpyrimidine/phosphomethylpyrimidine kinase